MAIYAPLRPITLAIAIFAFAGPSNALGGEQRAFFINSDPFQCSKKPNAPLSETCVRGDFILPNATRWNDLRTRLRLETKDHREFWASGGQVMLYLPAMDAIVIPSPSKNNGTPISTEPEDKPSPMPSTPSDKGVPSSTRKGPLLTTPPRGGSGPLIANVIGRTQSFPVSAVVYGLGGDPGDQRFADGARLPIPEIEATLNALLVELNAGWPTRAAPAPTVMIIASSSRILYSGPQGIFVPIGFLAAIGSDEELAFALAHELAHYKLGHFSTDYRQSMASFSAAARQLRSQQLALAADGSRSAQSASFTLDIAAFEDFGRRMVEQRSLRDEEDADAIAFDLLDKQQACALEAALSTLMQIRVNADRDEPAMDKLGKEAAAQLDKQLAAAMNLPSSNPEQLTAIRAATLRWATAQLASSRLFARGLLAPDPGARRAASLKAYVSRAYPTPRTNCTPQRPRLGSIRASDSYAEATRVVAALDATSMASEERPTAILRALGPALVSRYNSVPVVTENAAAAYMAAGKYAQAEELYLRAIQRETANGDIYAAYASLLIATAQYDRANSTLELAAARLGDGTVLLPQRVVLDLRRGKTDAALEALGECMMVGDDQLRATCRQVLTQPNAITALSRTTAAEHELLLKKLQLSGDPLEPSTGRALARDGSLRPPNP